MKKTSRLGGIAAAIGLAALALAPGVSTNNNTGSGNASGQQQVSSQQQSGGQVGQNQAQSPGGAGGGETAIRVEQPKNRFGGGGLGGGPLRYITRQFDGKKPYRPQRAAGPRTYNKTFHSRSRRRKAKRK